MFSHLLWWNPALCPHTWLQLACERRVSVLCIVKDNLVRGYWSVCLLVLPADFRPFTRWFPPWWRCPKTSPRPRSAQTRSSGRWTQIETVSCSRHGVKSDSRPSEVALQRSHTGVTQPARGCQVWLRRSRTVDTHQSSVNFIVEGIKNSRFASTYHSLIEI